jgi:hypothetical protein
MPGAPVWLGLCVILVVGCSSTPPASRSTASQREKDSVIGASKLPGAQGVRGALGAADSAAARNARLDSVANQR